MVVNYLVSEHTTEPLNLFYKSEHQISWSNVPTEIMEFKGVLKTKYSYSFKNLSAGTKHFFEIRNENDEIILPMHYFKTLPNGGAPVKVIQGGDLRSKNILADVAEGALKKDPDVILIGGDISYANGKLTNLDKWDDWFKAMEPVMITDDQRVIPLIVAIGNHEVTKFGLSKKTKAPFYFQLFPQNGDKTFFTRKLGAHSVLIVLDTGHIYSHRSQVEWLTQQFETYKHMKNKLAMYHVPLYPGHRKFETRGSKKGRKHWMGLFDKYNLTAAFENHDHVAKRTYPLKNNKKDPEGTVYFGDGCWGAGYREAQPERWYLDFVGEYRHVWFAELTEFGADFEAYSYNELIDSATLH